MAARENLPYGAGHNSAGNSPPAPPKSKASKVVALTGVGVVSLLLIGYCSAQDDDYAEVGADCVDLNSREPDGSYTLVDDDYCDDDSGRSGYHGSHGAYGWYYGGYRSGVRIGQGSTIRPSDVQIVSRKGTVIQRGGFGGRSGSGS
jgi:hypothetical protein